MRTAGENGEVEHRCDLIGSLNVQVSSADMVAHGYLN